MELTQLIALLGGLSLVIERSVEYLFSTFWRPGDGNNLRPQLLRALVLVVGIAVALTANIRLLEVAGYSINQYVDNVLSGVMIAGGSELMHQAFQRVKK